MSNPETKKTFSDFLHDARSEGVIIWQAMKRAAEGYTNALNKAGIEAELLLIPHKWNFAAYAYVPLPEQ